jgi:hypothetical protein
MVNSTPQDSRRPSDSGRVIELVRRGFSHRSNWMSIALEHRIFLRFQGMFQTPPPPPAVRFTHI